MENKTAIEVIISGRVQGVFYRAETKKTADRLGICGYVKNTPDGCVKAVFQADNENDVTKMLQWCRQGPANAIVTSVKTQAYSLSENFVSFDVRY